MIGCRREDFGGFGIVLDWLVVYSFVGFENVWLCLDQIFVISAFMPPIPVSVIHISAMVQFHISLFLEFSHYDF
jgi:hypothetical protein